MKQFVMFLATALAVAAPLAVAETMAPGGVDSRIQTALYSPNDVYRVHSMLGRSTLVQLQKGETVNSEEGLMISGDPQAWEIGVNASGNRIGINPKTVEEPDTNLIINTSQRTYVLDLMLVKKPADTTYVLRFEYPETQKKKSSPPKTYNENPCMGAVANRAYEKQGDLNLSPSEIWDNGTFTCLKFAANTPRPVLYQVLPDGTETLTNTRTVDNILVMHGVSKELRLRMNDQVLGLRTRQVGSSFNYSGTTTGEYREVKSAKVE